jgi:hypothetical protein
VYDVEVVTRACGEHGSEVDLDPSRTMMGPGQSGNSIRVPLHPAYRRLRVPAYDSIRGL